MNLSKISRSIIVAIFVVMIIFFSVIDVKFMSSKLEVTNSVTSNIAKLGYAAVLIFLVLIYMYIKEKLYRLKIKRKVSLVYRYIYTILIMIVTTLITMASKINEFSKFSAGIYVILSVVTGFVIKRIIFNVSKSDMLSVLGMFLHSMLLNVISTKEMMFNAILIELSTLSVIYMIQKLIDELKQKGIKTKKYLKFAFIIGILVAFNSALGVNIKVWGIIAILSIFITTNLDNTHFSFSNHMKEKIDSKKVDGILKIERINISKLIISIITSTIVSVLLYTLVNLLIKEFGDHIIIQNILELKNTNITNISFYNFHEYARNFVSFSKTYYMVLFIYILLMEGLAVLLQRRYDTKSTIIKLIFMTLFIVMSITEQNIYYYQPLFSILLGLIAIVNTTNIYYNREERIKMLVA